MSLRSRKPLRRIDSSVSLEVGAGAHPLLEIGHERRQHQGERRAQLVVDVGEKLHLDLVEGLQLFVRFLELGGRFLQPDPAGELARRRWSMI